jgi:hypothetical protein
MGYAVLLILSLLILFSVILYGSYYLWISSKGRRKVFEWCEKNEYKILNIEDNFSPVDTRTYMILTIVDKSGQARKCMIRFNFLGEPKFKWESTPHA